MADSHFIKTLIEPAMRGWLTDRYGGVFTEREMPLRWGGQGTGTFRFDAVNEDATILACLSTTGSFKAGQRHKLMRDATFMWLVPTAKTRLLAVIDPQVASALIKELQCGRLPPQTEVKVVELPADLSNQIGRFRIFAGEEVGGSKKRSLGLR